jgi:hypothetical protein
MSNKTIFKRIALVAVTALGAGVLSVAPASATNNAAVGSANAGAAAGILNVATLGSTSGDAETSTTTASNKSLGLLAVSTTLTTSSLTSTATVASSGEIVFYHLQTAGTNEVATTIEVSGGTIDEFVGAHSGAAGTDLTSTGTDPNLLLNSSKTMLAGGADANDDIFLAFGVKPNSGSSSITVSVYESAALATGSADAMETALLGILAGSVSKGTLKQRYLVTVAATSVSGVYSAADSYIAGATTAADNAETNVDDTDSLRIASQTAPYAYININLRDAYNVSLDGGKGALVITGTNGAGIAYSASGSAATAASDFNLTQVSNTSAAGTITVTKPAARANKSFSTTVSISWNGVVVGSKSVTFLGEVAKVTVTPRRVGALSASSTDAFRVAYEDDGGNALISLGTTATTVVAATTNSVVTGAAIGTQGSATDAAKGTLTCAAGSSAYLGGGSAQLQMQHVNAASGTTVLSNVFTATCQGNAYSYTASWDKASYTPGSVATLTIAFKDRDGDIANGYDTVGASNLITVTGGPSTTAVTIPATGDKPDGGTGLQGIKTFQFAVGTTEGDFVAVVSVPDVNSRNSSQANLSVPYSVKSATTVVTNADVLKSIVSLIASINKQIQALQKLILARR